MLLELCNWQCASLVGKLARSVEDHRIEKSVVIIFNSACVDIILQPPAWGLPDMHKKPCFSRCYSTAFTPILRENEKTHHPGRYRHMLNILNHEKLTHFLSH